MKDDLDVNSLLDDGLETGKKVMSAYEKTQRWTMYFMIGKVVMAFIVIVGILWGGYSLFTNVKDMITVAVVSEAKQVASEKTADLKLKASDKVAKIKADVAAKLAKRKDGDEADQKQSFFGAVTMLAKSIDTKIEAVIDEALVDNGVHPDAPGSCMFNPTPICDKYSEKEITGDSYSWMKTSWKSGDCSDIYLKGMDLLKTKGKVSMNDYRMLQLDCVDLRDQIGNAERDDRKRKMLEEL